MSGHPLDNYRFELDHYDFMPITQFNEIKDATEGAPNPNRVFRIAGLVVDAQHRVTKTGREFGTMAVEDFSGKTEVAFFSDDYVRFKNYLEKGKAISLNGFFKQRYNSDAFEFKASNICLLDTVKTTQTKHIEMVLPPDAVTKNFIDFVEKNAKENPGKAALKFKIYETAENLVVNMYTLEKGFTMNDAMSEYLTAHPEIEVGVGLVG